MPSKPPVGHKGIGWARPPEPPADWDNVKSALPPKDRPLYPEPDFTAWIRFLLFAWLATLVVAAVCGVMR